MPASSPLGFLSRNRPLNLDEITGNRPASEVLFDVERGGRFIVYQYCISLLIVSFRRNSKVTFVAPGESIVAKGLPYSLLTLLLGWWGFPWGLIYTPTVIYRNFKGGTDVTQTIRQRLT